MAYKIIRTTTNLHQTGIEITAVLDSAADLTDLGTAWAPGSLAIVAESGTPTYMMNASGEWKEV